MMKENETEEKCRELRSLWKTCRKRISKKLDGSPEGPKTVISTQQRREID